MAIRNSAPADGNSPLNFATPPNSHRVMPWIFDVLAPRLDGMAPARGAVASRRTCNAPTIPAADVDGRAWIGSDRREHNGGERPDDQSEHQQPCPVHTDLDAGHLAEAHGRLNGSATLKGRVPPSGISAAVSRCPRSHDRRSLASVFAGTVIAENYGTTGRRPMVAAAHGEWNTRSPISVAAPMRPARPAASIPSVCCTRSRGAKMATILRWDPAAQMERLQRDIERMFAGVDTGTSVERHPVGSLVPGRRR